MKMKFAILASAMMAVGIVSTASAEEPPLTVTCSENWAEACIGDVLVEVELKCNGDYDGGMWVGDPGLPLDWLLIVRDSVEPYIDLCATMGDHLLLKTEGKCTDKPNGPTKGNKNFPKGTEFAVEYEIKTVKDTEDRCPES